MIEARPPTIPQCDVCGAMGMRQDVYGSFCMKHWPRPAYVPSVNRNGTETWTRSALDAGKPYSVWKAPRMPWWAVLDCHGLNVLSNGTGRVFTDEETAARLAQDWNA